MLQVLCGVSITDPGMTLSTEIRLVEVWSLHMVTDMLESRAHHGSTLNKFAH